MTGHFPSSEEAREAGRRKIFRNRILLLFAGIFLGIIILLVNLFRLQLLGGDEWRQTISRQYLRSIRIPALRGRIYAAGGEVLAENRPVWQVVFYPEEMRRKGRKRTLENMMMTYVRLAKELRRDARLTVRDFEAHLNRTPGLPMVVLDDLSPQEAGRALELIRLNPGVDLENSSCRFYPYGGLTGNLTGYARQGISGDEPDRGDYFYYLPDLSGKDALELAFDRKCPAEYGNIPGLRGEPGYSLIQVDHLGYARHDVIEKLEPWHGNHLVLTVDLKAQKLGAELLGSRRGALVALDADTGDVLAAVTSPRVNVNRFYPLMSGTLYQQMLKHPDNPLFDRALRGSFTPGSIVKPLTALALLRCGVTPESSTECNGYNPIGNAVIRCAAYRRGGHGGVNMYSGLCWSCNSYFINFMRGRRLETLREVMTEAGIGRRPRLEIPCSGGVFPGNAEKLRRYRVRWNAFDTAMLSMGQGMISLSPLQAALYAAAFANGGKIMRPHLVSQVRDNAGNVLYRRKVEVESSFQSPPEDLAVVREGMYQVVNSSTGSGRNAKVAGLKIYGKTGSAEFGSRNNRRVNTWFIAFTECKGRRIAVSVLTEEGISGGRDCAPVAGEFLRRYLLEDNPPPATEAGTETPVEPEI